jgi:hypothetical protein
MKWIGVAVLLLMSTLASAQPAAQPATTAATAQSDHAKKDITRHRAMAAAHEAAAKCLESGKAEDACHKDLQAACKGLAIGKYCGMRHEH